MRLFAARHGQTQWNVENKICGVTDLPLTEEGWALRDQAAKIPGEIARQLQLAEDEKAMLYKLLYRLMDSLPEDKE